MYCKQCGKEIAPRTRFCTGCGAAIGKASIGTTKAASGVAFRINPKVWVGLGALAGIALLVTGGKFAFDKWGEWRANQFFAEVQQLVRKARKLKIKGLPVQHPQKKALIQCPHWMLKA